MPTSSSPTTALSKVLDMINMQFKLGFLDEFEADARGGSMWSTSLATAQIRQHMCIDVPPAFVSTTTPVVKNPG